MCSQIVITLTNYTPTKIAHTQTHTHTHTHTHTLRYWHFEETLLTLSRVVDMSTIYLRRYAVGAFVAIMCTNKSGQFQ